MVLITEAAKEIPGYEGKYAVTKNGVVYSLPRKRVKKLKIMTAVDNMKAGYLRVRLSCNGDSDLIYIHQLIALTYIPNPEKKRFVNHIDGIKTNNRLDNLEWVTAQENRDHAHSLALYPKQKIYSSQKKDVYELFSQGVPIREIADMYGMSYGGAYNVITRYRKPELQMAA